MMYMYVVTFCIRGATRVTGGRFLNKHDANERAAHLTQFHDAQVAMQKVIA